MSEQTILLDKQINGITTLTLNRPKLHNAFDDIMVAELTTLLAKLENDQSTKVVMLAANGPSFSAGADLNWMQRMVAYNLTENIQDASLLAKLMQTLNFLNKPTIAIVQGPVYGGGTGLVACCDIAIGTSNAEFCFSEVKLGLIPAVISPYIITAIGERMARRYFLTAEKISATMAQQIGLLHEIVKSNQLTDHALQIAHQLLKNSPQAITTAKKLIQKISQHPINQNIINTTAEAIANIRVSVEGQEGLTAFLQKRPPHWLANKRD